VVDNRDEITGIGSRENRLHWKRPAGPYTHTPQVQNYAAKHRPSTRQNICESL